LNTAVIGCFQMSVGDLREQCLAKTEQTGFVDSSSGEFQ